MIRRGPHSVVTAALGILGILSAVGCGAGTKADAPTAPPTTTTPTTPAVPLPIADWVEGIDGQIPLVIIAPHGGT